MQFGFKDWLKKQEEQPRAWWRYGHYCGPGPRLRSQTCDMLHSGKPLPAPINAVDAACQRHDVEYCKCGVGWEAGVIGGKPNTCSLQSDEKLVAHLQNLEGLPLKQKLAAATIKNYFNLHMRTQGHQRGNS